jgi:hypothetical protein
MEPEIIPMDEDFMPVPEVTAEAEVVSGEPIFGKPFVGEIPPSNLFGYYPDSESVHS